MILFIIIQVILWICVITAVTIMVPQIVALHRNKYADNSSVWTYWVYFFCNLIWTIYQTLYIIWRIYYANDNPPDTLELSLLGGQLASDIIALLIAVYLVIIKYYFLNIFKKIRKSKISENKKMLIQQKNSSFIKKNIYLIENQYNNFYKLNPKLCTKIVGKSFKDLIPKDKINMLLKILKIISRNLDDKHLINVYGLNNKLMNKFIINYKEMYPNIYKQIISTLKIKTLNLQDLSYEIKLRIVFIQLSNLI